MPSVFPTYEPANVLPLSSKLVSVKLVRLVDAVTGISSLKI